MDRGGAVNAIVSGLIARYPFGGMTFHYVQYLLGLRDLGWEVAYLEDSGHWFYDPANATFVEDATPSLAYLGAEMERFGLGDAWVVRDRADRLHGPLAASLPAVLDRADVLVNVSGACWLRPEYEQIPTTIYVDTDPGYTQFKLATVARGEGDAKLAREVDLIAKHRVHASFGENIGLPGCSIPAGPLRWVPTRQPIHLDLWHLDEPTPPVRFTSVLSWDPYAEPLRFDGRRYWGKRREFERVADLPRLTGADLELAVSGPMGEPDLRAHGWRIRPAEEVSASSSSYRDYIASSGAELSVAKDVYVRNATGWFSERSACYLASGRPVVVQDTGFTRVLPAGVGLHAFSDGEQAAAAVARVIDGYPQEREAARHIAEEHFDARRVLTDLLTAARVAEAAR
jgi:hypothetical protein